MELIERYLQAVKFWLPRRQKDDIIAELSADIYAQIEERETQLGRKLTETEVEALLKQRGHPLLVANRFHPQGYLIGPVLFPVYTFVLKIVALGYLVPWVLVWIGLMTFSPAYRAEQTHASWFAAIGSMWGSWWTTAFAAIGTVTLVFAILERVQASTRLFEDWSPRKLPAVRNPNLIPRSASSIELAVNLIFIAWWAAYAHSPEVQIGSVLHLSLQPQWIWFFWGYLLLALLNAALAGMNLMHPVWSVPRATYRLLTDSAGAVLFCALMKAHILAGIAMARVPAQQGLAIAHVIDDWMDRLFPAAIVVGCVVVATGVYRVVRAGRASASLPL